MSPLAEHALTRPTDRARIERYLRGDPGRHLYAIGDLDDAFWLRTRWWALESANGIEAIVLRYGGLHTPTVLALGADRDALRALLGRVRDELDPRMYLHLEPGLAEVLSPEFELRPHGPHLRMMLTRPLSDDPEPGEVAWLTPADEAAALAFYARAFPGNWFDPRMLQTGRYAAVRDGAELLAVAGVHVFSRRLGVAALGNVATAPAHRRSGLGRRVTLALCRRLLDEGCTVGLNVAADNSGAIALYESLGFSVWSALEEYEAQRR